MSGGLVALLDDIATLAKLAAASVDDVAGAAGRASSKAAGVVIDDTAVTPNYVVGLSPARELPMIWKITKGSLRNKLLFLLPAALLLSALAPWAITPLLMAGGAYLSFEATEKIWEKLSHAEHAEQAIEPADPHELEARQVSGAIRTDFILSAEIMAIALNELPALSLPMQAAVLAAVAVIITLGVYGVVGLIVKMDDIGLHLSQRSSRLLQVVSRGLVRLMPVLLRALSLIGIAAMLWVGGGIVLHGLHTYHFTPAPEWVDAASVAAESSLVWAGGITKWVVHALGSAIIGLIVGGLIVVALHVAPRRRQTT
jgi:predicted DNA repair protein MutK